MKSLPKDTDYVTDINREVKVSEAEKLLTSYEKTTNVGTILKTIFYIKNGIVRNFVKTFAIKIIKKISTNQRTGSQSNGVLNKHIIY